MLGLVRLRMLRDGISKYWTRDLASRSSLSEARRAIPTSAIPDFRLLFAIWQVGRTLWWRRHESAGEEQAGAGLMARGSGKTLDRDQRRFDPGSAHGHLRYGRPHL